MDVARVLKNYRDRGFDAMYFETGKEAVDFLATELSGESIGFGGSITSQQLGLYERLGENNKVLWHWVNAADIGAFSEFTAYISSVNGASEEGELVNIDGTGNRIAATLYGPKTVVFVVGKNKLTPNMHTAIDRARNVAAPLNAKRLNRETPCVVDLKCHDCKTPQRICRGMSIHMRPLTFANRTLVLFIGEELGY